MVFGGTSTQACLIYHIHIPELFCAEKREAEVNVWGNIALYRTWCSEAPPCVHAHGPDIITTPAMLYAERERERGNYWLLYEAKQHYHGGQDKLAGSQNRDISYTPQQSDSGQRTTWKGQGQPPLLYPQSVQRARPRIADPSVYPLEKDQGENACSKKTIVSGSSIAQSWKQPSDVKA